MVEKNITLTSVPENNTLCWLLTLLTLGTFRFFSVPQGNVRVITLFGRYLRAEEPGLGRCLSLWGLYQNVGPLVPTMEQVDDYRQESFFTKDGVNCIIDAVVFFSVRDPKKALFEIDDYRLAIKNLVQAILRNQCGTLTARELLAGREKIALSIKEVLEADAAPWGISIRLAEIKEIRIGVPKKEEKV